MKARQYVEQQFIPWILFLDTKEVIKHFEDKKEQYLCETYNHVSKEFKAIEHYEMYMFRVNISKLMTPKGSCKFIVATLPEVMKPNDSKMIVIADFGNVDDLCYFYLECSYVNQYDLVKRTKTNRVLMKSFENYNFDSVLLEIKKELLEMKKS